ncbi:MULTISPECIES: hypothetical protein [Calothrix]|uniref:Uncharacterized protein n=2 Tax=Calothrix TaxID=1186 RepID=A0ABR8AJD9_9CYAN|nr:MULTISPECIES: hypothetical protein [Calothrix]MBD2200165.1 hypothetical protein [Calothrix parietina FACHB-288]MBD2229125.1 hypothetical protein [Calothrix anomala FACHB-343]
MYTETLKPKEQFVSSKQFGLLAEEAVKKWLNLLGSRVIESTVEENIEQDIDIYVNDIPCSIKAISHSYSRKNRPGFELLVLDGGKWKTSWFINGKSTNYYYISFNEIYVELWVINKPRVVEHVKNKGWDFTTQLTKDIKESQRYHRHKDTALGFLNFETIKEHKLGKKLDVITLTEYCSVENLLDYLDKYYK